MILARSSQGLSLKHNITSCVRPRAKLMQVSRSNEQHSIHHLPAHSPCLLSSHPVPFYMRRKTAGVSPSTTGTPYKTQRESSSSAVIDPVITPFSPVYMIVDVLVVLACQMRQRWFMLSSAGWIGWCLVKKRLVRKIDCECGRGSLGEAEYAKDDHAQS